MYPDGWKWFQKSSVICMVDGLNNMIVISYWMGLWYEYEPYNLPLFILYNKEM